MEDFREIASGLLIGPGAIFCAIGGLGLIRLPEFYARMHGSGVTDTLGAALLLMSWMLQPADCLVTVKLLSILILLYITSPTAGHALIHAAYTSGHMPKLADDAAQPPEVPKP